MLIEIICGNFSRFDPASGQYLECGERLAVAEDKVGQFVNCTKCQQPVEVPFGYQNPPQISESAKAANETKSKPPLPNSKASSGKKRRKKSSSKRPAIPAAPSDGDELSLAAPEPRMKSSDVMSMDFGTADVAPVLGEDTHDRCTKCGNVSKDGRCTVCRHVEQEFDKLHEKLDDIEIELVGFQRWFCKTMNEGASIGVLQYAAHFGFGFMAVLAMCIAVAGISGIAISVTAGVVLLILTLMSIGFYVGLVYKGHQFRKDPRARLAWFQKPLWNGILSLARSSNWQGYDSSLKGRTVIKVKEKMFRDNEIPDLENFKSCSVLDLQGTNVSDKGLLYLYSLKHLQCVVLKNTNVSHEGVFRLQQSFPKLWIWY